MNLKHKNKLKLSKWKLTSKYGKINQEKKTRNQKNSLT